MKRIFINKDLCQGCLGCEVACMAEHHEGGKSVYDICLSDPAASRLNTIQLDSAGRPVPVFCRHCDDPECVRACMSGAMRKDPDSGAVFYDKRRCASCYMCLMSCRYGVLKTDLATRQVIQKCDLCRMRETPRCVEECPVGALEYKEGE